MSIKIIRSMTEVACETSKLIQIKRNLTTSVWSIDTGEVLRVFAPRVMRKSGGRYDVSGFMGLWIPEFEEYWSSLLKQSSVEKIYQVNSSLVLGSNIKNFPELLTYPLIDENNQALLNIHIENISAFLRTLPDCIESLLEGLYQEKFGPYVLWIFFGHKVKWDAFANWLSVNFKADADFIKRLNRRKEISPYENLYKTM